MGFLNDIILSQPDSGAQLYDLTGTVGMAVMVAVTVWYIGRMKLPPLKAVAVLVIGHYLTVAIHSLVMWMMEGFAPDRYGAEANLAVGFVYMPLIALLMAWVFNLPWNTVAEQMAVSMLSFHVLGRSGCIFTGCCYGYPCEWGLWSIQQQSYCFPVVLVESAFTLGILVFLLCRIGRKGYTPDGKSMPLMLMLYGVCRFGSEFLRDNDKILWGLSNISLHALFMAAVGAVLLVWMTRKERKATPSEPIFPTVKGRRR